jgi:bleomycin hydrolase
MNIDENKHNHGEMFAILQAVVNGASKSRKLTPNWQAAFAVVLNTYLGAPPIDFTFNGNKYTPKSFAEKYCGWNLTDYIELTSYLHHPFYEQCRLEIPDNWTCNDDYYNIPIDDLEKIIDYAIQNGYSIVWDGDVSERDFSTRETGYAIITEKDWDDKSEAERKAKITTPLKEKKVTQEMRQLTFDNYLTTDDHLMHIVGLAHDQKGTKFYYTKNSGGVIDRKNEGYVYMSQAYMRLKTVAIMVNKNCLPKKMLTKLFLK